MKPASFAYHRPASVPEAVKLMADLAPEDGRIIAGGQSLVPMMAFRLARPQHLIDINRVAGLDVFAVDEKTIRIGATVRHAAIEHNDSPSVLPRFLAYVARHIAHAPIRSRGTFCGSIANSDPASEWCLVTATLDGEIIADSLQGVRVLPASSFFFGTMTNALAPDEMITEVRLPALPPSVRWGFHEVARVAGGFALAAAAVVFRVEDGRIAEPRVGIGGVEGTPRRIPEAEAELQGVEIGRIDVDRVAAAAAAAVDPMPDGQSDVDFKRHVTHTVTALALRQCLA